MTDLIKKKVRELLKSRAADRVLGGKPVSFSMMKHRRYLIL